MMTIYRLEDRVLYDAAAAADAAVAIAQENHDNPTVANPNQAPAAGQEQTSTADVAAGSPAQQYADHATQTAEAAQYQVQMAAAEGDNASQLQNDINSFIDSVMTHPDAAPVTTTNVLLVDTNRTNADALAADAAPDTIVIKYDALHTTSQQLIADISTALDGRKADAIGIAVESDSKGNIDLLKADSDTAFWNDVTPFLTDTARIDFLGSNMADSAYVNAVATLTGHQTAASNDLTGTGGDWILESANIDVSQVYFGGHDPVNVTFSVHSAETSHNLVIVNSSVLDSASVIDAIDSNNDVLVLDKNADPLTEINLYLDAHDDVKYDSISIVTHGNDGYFVLNGRIVDTAYVNAHQAEFADLGSHMTVDGDIMIYGCDLAADDAGKNLVAQIGEFTGADVAASTDTTGGIGGNWNLEYHYGLVTTTEITIDAYQYHLTDAIVTAGGDSGAGTLRQAILDVDATGGSITVNMIGNDTVTVTSELTIANAMSINGYNNATTNNITVQVTTPGAGGTASRVFNISNATGTVTISNMTIKGGDTSARPGVDSYGGGIYISAGGALTLDHVMVSGSKSQYGGGIFSEGTLTMTDCTISGNSANNIAGGIYVSNCSVTLTNCSISGNSGDWGSGGLQVTGGSATISQCSISENSSGTFGDGGGLQVSGGTVNLINSTVANNSSITHSGGGIYVYSGTATITDCTVTGNIASNTNAGAGIYNFSGNVYLTNSIVAYNYKSDNSGYSDISGALTQSNYNIIGGTDYSYTSGMGASLFASYETIAANTVYRPVLGNNGGSTSTVALALDSIAQSTGVVTGTYASGSKCAYSSNGGATWQAVENGSIVTEVTRISTDQRGISRSSTSPSIGAYEYAVQYRAADNGNWNSASTWEVSTDGINWFAATVTPDANNSYFIAISGHSVSVTAAVTIDQTSISADGIVIINSGIALTVANGSGTDLTVTGTLTNNGTLTVNNGSTVAYDGGNQTIAAGIYYNLALSNAGIKSATDVAASNNLTMSNGVTLSLTGALTVNNTFSAGDGTVNYSGGYQTVTNLSYYNLDLSGSNTKSATNVTASNNLTMSNGVTLVLAGALNVGNTFTAGTGTVYYNGAAQNIAALNYYNLILSGSDDKTLAGNICIANTLTTIAGTFVHNNFGVTYNGAAQDIAALNYYNLTLSGSGTKSATDITATHNLTISNGVTLALTGALTVSGTFTAGTGTVNYKGAAQNIAALNYYNLTFDGSGNKTLAGNIGIANTFTITAGTFVHGNHGVNYNGSDQTVVNLSYYNLTLSGSGTKSATNVTASNHLTMSNSVELSLTEALNVTDAHFTAGTGTVNYSGGNQTVSALNYNTLMLSGSGSTKTFADGITKVATEIAINNAMTLTGSSASAVTVQVTNPGVTVSRAFNITNATGTVTISNMTIKGGDISSLGGFDCNGGAIYKSGAGALTFDAVTISDGLSTYGGGMYINEGSVTLTNSTISDNTATQNGGGICNYYYSGALSMTNCNISNNIAVWSYGGGIYNQSLTTASINLCTISGNTANNMGGGGLFSEGNMTLTDSTFSGNSAFKGGGIWIQSSQMTLTDCTFSSNNALNDGGGLYSLSGTVTAAGCTFNGNTATQDGGGIYSNAGTLTLTDSTISGNTAGLFAGGIANEFSTINVTGCTINGNTAYDGGGIYNFYHDIMSLNNTTISGNKASQNGGGVYNMDAAELTLINCTVTGNSAINGGAIYSELSAKTYLTNSIVAYNYVGGVLNHDFYNSSGTFYGNYNIVGSSWTGSGSNNITTPYTAHPAGTGNYLFANFVNDTLTGNVIPELKDNGGATKTIALSIASQAIVSSVRTGTYYDYNTYYAYSADGVTWHKVENSNTITGVSEITTDQRGENRNTTRPCAGAYFQAQSTLFRTVADGNWSEYTIWEASNNGIDWVAAGYTPTADNSTGISVAHTVHDDINVTIDQTTITGALTVDSGNTFTIANGTGTDLTVTGSLIKNGDIVCQPGSSVEYADGTTVAATSYYNLILSGTGSKTLAGDISIAGNLINNAMINGSGYGITFNGNTLQTVTNGAGADWTAIDSFTIANASGVKFIDYTTNVDNVIFQSGNILLQNSELFVAQTVTGASPSTLFILDSNSTLSRITHSPVDFFVSTGTRYINLQITASTGVKFSVGVVNGINSVDMAQWYNMTLTITEAGTENYTLAGLNFDPNAEGAQFNPSNYVSMQNIAGTWSQVSSFSGSSVAAFTTIPVNNNNGNGNESFNIQKLSDASPLFSHSESNPPLNSEDDIASSELDNPLDDLRDGNDFLLRDDVFEHFGHEYEWMNGDGIHHAFRSEFDFALSDFLQNVV